MKKGDRVLWVPFGIEFDVDRVHHGEPETLFAKGGTQGIWARDCVLVDEVVHVKKSCPGLATELSNKVAGDLFG